MLGGNLDPFPTKFSCGLIFFLKAKQNFIKQDHKMDLDPMNNVQSMNYFTCNLCYQMKT